VASHRVLSPIADRLSGRWALLRSGKLHLGQLAAVAADAYGDRPAHILSGSLPYDHLSGSKVTYAEVGEFVERAAAALADEHGVRPGDRVVVSPANRVDTFWWILAVAAAGGVAVPVNPASGDKDLAWARDDSGATLVLSDDMAAPGLSACLKGARRGRAPVGGETDASAVILYTSGTTGRAKGVVLTSAALLSGLGWAVAAPPWPVRLIIEAMPVAHVMGLAVTLMAFVSGIPVLHLPRFRPNEVLDAIEIHKANLYVGVPTTYRRLEEAGAADRDLSSIRAWASAADVMPPDLMRRFQGYGRSQPPLPVPALFIEGYGMVESAGAAMLRLTLPGRKTDAPGFVGAPLPGWKARVVDDSGAEVPRGDTGHLELSGPGVLSEYLGEREATEETVRQGWLHTGDLAWRDRLGLVHFAGRSKEVIKTGGYSVFPAEVEAHLREHPDVADVVVFGIDHSARGQDVVAAVVVRPGAALDQDAFLTWGRDRMARYKAPRDVFQVSASDLPMGPTKKVLRGSLSLRFGGAEGNTH
jgi:acyl-CoA synthetase (AMP-forming)/AMP-acid ligase II